jgi:FtsZ-interacting cell division protein ZipA
MSTGTVVVIVIVAIIVIAAVILLSLRARRRKAEAKHHIGLPEMGSLSKAAEQTEGGVDHEKGEESQPSTQQLL